VRFNPHRLIWAPQTQLWIVPSPQLRLSCCLTGFLCYSCLLFTIIINNDIGSMDDTLIQQNCSVKDDKKCNHITDRIGYNYTWIRFQNNANGARALVGKFFLCGVERVKHFVKVHLHCIVRNLKKDKQKCLRCPPLEKFLRTSMLVTWKSGS